MPAPGPKPTPPPPHPKPPGDRDAGPMSSRGAPTWMPSHAHDDDATRIDLPQGIALACLVALAIYLSVK